MLPAIELSSARGKGAPPPPNPSPRSRAIPSPSGQTGQHSPAGTLALGQFLISSQITSSHNTLPLSQTQIWQGTGFHTSRSWYLRPFCTQVTGGTGGRWGPSAALRVPHLGAPGPSIPPSLPLGPRGTFRFSISGLSLFPSLFIFSFFLPSPPPPGPFVFPFPKSLKAHLLLISTSDRAEAPGQVGYNSFQFSGI